MLARAQALVRHAGRALVSPAGLLTLGFAALYLATFDSQLGSPDEQQRFRLARELAAHGPRALLGSGSVSRYPPLLSLLAAPLVRVGLWLDAAAGGGAKALWTDRLGLSVSLLACIALIPLFHAAARALDVPARTAAAATALFGLTNPVWPYSKRFFSEPLTAALMLGAFTGALVWARGGRRAPLVAGLACLALLPLNNLVLVPPAFLAVALVLAFDGGAGGAGGEGESPRRRGWRRVVGALAALAATGVVAVALLAAVSWVRLGALTSGYGSEVKFPRDFAASMRGLLIGPGRSIFLYAPLLVLSIAGAPALWRRSRGAALGAFGALALALALVGSWWCWWGGICWGPRLMLPVLPIASLGAPALLSSLRARRRWARVAVAVPVLLAGLYVQGLGVAFKHDFDIYFWMKSYFVDEQKAWFTWEYSALHRMPRHFREHPWDLSSAFLALEPQGPSVVEVQGRPVRVVQITERGDALTDPWSITDLYVVLSDGRRLAAGEIGARLETSNGPSGAGALDGDPATAWSTGRKRLDGDWVRLVLPEPRADLERLELEHLPRERDFPNGLTARAAAEDGGSWAELPARAATPRLHWNPLIFALAAAGLAFLLAAARRAETLSGAHLRISSDEPLASRPPADA